jgi:hypothetical protein
MAGAVTPQATRRWEPALAFAIVLAVYVAATPVTSQAYRHFVYMARAFLEGHVDLRGLPDHYHDVVRVGGRVYPPFPPLPAVILMPVVALQGEAADQGRVGQVLAALAAAVFLAGLGRLRHAPAVRWFGAAALAFGSVLWPSAAIGTTWFFAQEVVVLATALIVWELAGMARPVIVGALIVAAWLTRVSMLPAVPVLAAMLWARHRGMRPVAAFLAVNAAGILVYMWYNVLRFGDPFQTGYRLLSYATPNAVALSEGGFFSLKYLSMHLSTMFLQLPEWIARPPFFKPSPWGMSLLLTSPVIIRLVATTADRRSWLGWGALILSIAVPMVFFFSNGWVQFGYRYSLDWWVFALVLVAAALRGRPRPLDYSLLVLSIAVNAAGVYWVKELGW